MNELYPIIRRVRRPLLEANAETRKAEILKADKGEPVKPVAELGNIQPPTSSVEDSTRPADEEITTQGNAG